MTVPEEDVTKLTREVRAYDDYHRTPFNRLLHYFGIPAFVIGVLGLASRLTFPLPFTAMLVDPALVVLAIVVIWYAIMDWQVALVAGIAGLGCYAIGIFLSVPVLAVAIALAVIAHVVGHTYFEHNHPAFLQHPTHILISPLWLISLWTRSIRSVS